MNPKEIAAAELTSGQVGYIATGLKRIEEVRVGDTITLDGQFPTPIEGYQEPVLVVFLSFYPQDSSVYLNLREAMERLSLSDAAFSFEPESIGNIGKGFRCGFLGLLHADIIKERIEREFDIEIITTTPSVKYIVEKTDGNVVEVKSASEYPEVTKIREAKEPWA
ncbi:elongation factor 4, partial [Arthrospira platensis SPKY2]